MATQEVKSMALSEMRQSIENPKEAKLPAVTVGFTTLQSFELVQRAGKLLASSSLVPKEYQGNLANCVIALNMAHRIGADPLMVMQNLYIVHNRPSWSSQFLIATFNSCGRFSALRYDFVGEEGTDSWGCRAWAIEKSTGEKIIGSLVTIEIAKKEGWYNKNGSKWLTMPQQMLMYRAAAWFIRAHAPELAMGLHTVEEVHDSVIDVEATVVTSDSLKQDQTTKKQGKKRPEKDSTGSEESNGHDAKPTENTVPSSMGESHTVVEAPSHQQTLSVGQEGREIEQTQAQGQGQEIRGGGVQ